MGQNGYFGGEMGWEGWLAMGVGLLVFWGFVIGGVALLVHSVARRNDGAPRPADASAALRVLDERFARGEVDADEYGERRRLLTST